MGKKGVPRTKPRNWELCPGVLRFSRARMFQRRGVYKKKAFAVVKKVAKNAVEYVTKKVGGDKNGKERKVPTTKTPRFLGESRPSRRVHRKRAATKQKLRSSIKPGSVLIVLAGRHKGKRVVFLKQLESGLLLVTGECRTAPEAGGDEAEAPELHQAGLRPHRPRRAAQGQARRVPQAARVWAPPCHRRVSDSTGSGRRRSRSSGAPSSRAPSSSSSPGGTRASASCSSSSSSLGSFSSPVSVGQHRKRAATKQKLRSSIKPGSVLIVLAGRHKGKRVVFLKQLESGLLLVTGPLKLNNCPLRRIAQCYVIATATHVDVTGVKLPAHVDDAYFRRARKSKRAAKGEDTDIFASTKTEYTVSDQRKADQKSVDGAILAAVKKSGDKKALLGYLGSSFSLQKGQFPHSLKF